MATPPARRRPSPPIKWHGGKHYLAPRIIALFPPHRHYVEPFFGGGAVLFRKPPALVDQHSEVINDLDGELTNFWRALQSDETFEAFRRRVETIPFSSVEWDAAAACESDDPLERAVAFFVRYRQSRQGLGTCFATMSRSRTRRGMNEQAASWWSAVEGLDEAHHRLRRVVIMNLPAATLIRREDSPDSFFYCDPPYVADTRVATKSYRFEMNADQHGELLETLAGLTGKFILSGYRHPLYDDIARRMDWHRIDIAIDNKASSGKTKPIQIESLWMNFRPEPDRPAEPSDDQQRPTATRVETRLFD